MPTLLIVFGIRFFFYMDEQETIHIPISYGGKKAKIELVPTVKNALAMNKSQGGNDMEKIKTIWFDADRIYMKTQEGRVYSRPLEAYPELKDATTEQRNDYVIGDDGEDIRWESIDADMYISSFHEVTEPKDNEIAQMFAHYPWLNVSEVARAIGINKSLMARYIYGISKPSEKRVQQIRDALHQFGKELLSA